MQDAKSSKQSRPAVDDASGLELLGVPPNGGAIYDLALTHRSFAYEQATPIAHNERLEFLGDAVLGVVVTRLIFDTYPDLSEGEMARLRASVVNTGALADVARRISERARRRREDATRTPCSPTRSRPSWEPSSWIAGSKR
jgi:dsRNA-specific ribonuclease